MFSQWGGTDKAASEFELRREDIASHFHLS